MNADTAVWAAIAIMTMHNSLTDVSVIHGKYTLDAKQKLNIVWHQTVIVMALLGLLFESKTNIQTHLFLISMCALCWLWFDGCFMAIWQRDNITYTPEDFTIIQKTKGQRLFEFLGMVVPLFFIDLYKLRALP